MGVGKPFEVGCYDFLNCMVLVGWQNGSNFAGEIERKSIRRSFGASVRQHAETRQRACPDGCRDTVSPPEVELILTF